MDTRDKVAVWIAEYDRSMIAMIKEGAGSGEAAGGEPGGAVQALRGAP